MRKFSWHPALSDPKKSSHGYTCGGGGGSHLCFNRILGGVASERLWMGFQSRFLSLLTLPCEGGRSGGLSSAGAASPSGTPATSQGKRVLTPGHHSGTPALSPALEGPQAGPWLGEPPSSTQNLELTWGSGRASVREDTLHSLPTEVSAPTKCKRAVEILWLCVLQGSHGSQPR